MTIPINFPLAGYWLFYFALHSLLASMTFKHATAQHFPGFMPYYRLTFNGLAILLLLPVLLLVDFTAPLILVWEGAWRWLSYLMAAIALAGFVWSLSFYDNAEFLGLKQWRDQRAEVAVSLRISPLHRFVRHPWYLLGLLLIWSRDLNADMLLSAFLLTGYLFVGAWFEERKLIALHGQVYAEYCRRVPGLIPLPWRYLSAQEARHWSDASY
jgi:protein-S-isoprenylcysteine O-methyltransferase Ste14